MLLWQDCKGILLKLIKVSNKSNFAKRISIKCRWCQGTFKKKMLWQEWQFKGNNNAGSYMKPYVCAKKKSSACRKQPK